MRVARMATATMATATARAAALAVLVLALSACTTLSGARRDRVEAVVASARPAAGASQRSYRLDRPAS